MWEVAQVGWEAQDLLRGRFWVCGLRPPSCHSWGAAPLVSTGVREKEVRNVAYPKPPRFSACT